MPNKNHLGYVTSDTKEFINRPGIVTYIPPGWGMKPDANTQIVTSIESLTSSK